MTITEADIKFLAAERELDDPDGGGFMTGNVIVSGVENNLFPDISSMDRATGAVDFRKVFLAVLTAGEEVYLGAHAIIDAIPADPNVSGLMFESESAGEDRTALIERLNETAAIPAYGCKMLQEDAAVSDRTVKVDGLDVMLIPSSNVGETAEGQVTITSTQGGHSSGLIAAATTAPFLIETFGGLNKLSARMGALYNSASGTSTDALGTATLTSEGDATPGVYPNRELPMLMWDGAGPTIFLGEGTYVRFNGGGIAQAVTATTGTYQPVFPVTFPLEVYEFTWNYGMGAFQTFTLPHLPEVGSESLLWAFSSFQDVMMVSRGGNPDLSFQTDPSVHYAASCSVDRATGLVTAVFDPLPPIGTKVRFYYARAGYAQGIDDSCIDTVFNDNLVHLTASAGYKIDQAVFRIGSIYYKIFVDGTVRQQQYAYGHPTWGAVVGSFDRNTGMLGMIMADGTAIADWWGVEIADDIPLSPIVTGIIPADLDAATLELEGTENPSGDPWTATCDASGEITGAIVSGTYDKMTGQLTLEFTADSNSLITWTADQLSFIKAPDEITGLQGGAYPTSGKVNVFRTNQVVVVHNTKTVAAATYVNGNTVNFGRTLIAEARVYGPTGTEYATGFSVNKATGVLTFTDVSGMTMPVTIKHRVEDMALLVSVTAAGELRLSKPLQHNYDADANDCWVSSVLSMGDLQAKVHPSFQQATWTGVWQDTPIGSGISADYNDPLYPIEVTNHGAITQRWAIQWTNTTSFQCIGEETGIIGTGNIASDFAPINPATGHPYFTINHLGWGAGWATGNVLRFNTDGANNPLWVVRSIAPSDPFVGQDKITIAARGDIDA